MSLLYSIRIRHEKGEGMSYEELKARVEEAGVGTIDDWFAAVDRANMAQCELELAQIELDRLVGIPEPTIDWESF